MAALTTREALVQAAKSRPRVKEIDVPELGASVFIRIIGGDERDAYEASIDDGKRRNLANFRARFVVLVLCDNEGKRVYGDGEALAAAHELGAPAIVRIFDEARSFNGMTEKDVQELAGN